MREAEKMAREYESVVILRKGNAAERLRDLHCAGLLQGEAERAAGELLRENEELRSALVTMQDELERERCAVGELRRERLERYKMGIERADGVMARAMNTMLLGAAAGAIAFAVFSTVWTLRF